MSAVLAEKIENAQAEPATKVSADTLKDLFRRYRIESNPEKATALSNEIIMLNQRLVTSVAKHFIGLLDHTSLDFQDLTQEGNLGLMRAIQDYDPELGFAFSTYAVNWIREYIGRSIANNANTIRIPVYMVEKIRIVRNASAKFHKTNGRMPSISELKDITGCTEAQVEDILSYAALSNIISLSSPVNAADEREIELWEIIDSHDSSHEEVLDTIVQTEIEAKMKDLLTDKEYDIICRRLALGKYENIQTLQEIGDIYDVSRERVRQIESYALKKLRRKLSYIFGDL